MGQLVVRNADSSALRDEQVESVTSPIRKAASPQSFTFLRRERFLLLLEMLSVQHESGGNYLRMRVPAHVKLLTFKLIRRGKLSNDKHQRHVWLCCLKNICD